MLGFVCCKKFSFSMYLYKYQSRIRKTAMGTSNNNGIDIMNNNESHVIVNYGSTINPTSCCNTSRFTKLNEIESLTIR